MITDTRLAWYGECTGSQMSFERRTRVFNMCYYGEAKPVAGGWTPWSQCDCGGTDQKTRSCTNPTRDTDGAECPDDGLGTSTDCASECSMDEPETLPVGEGEGEGEGCGCGSAIKGYFWNFEPCAGYSFPLETLEECKAAWDNGISDTYKLSVSDNRRVWEGERSSADNCGCLFEVVVSNSMITDTRLAWYGECTGSQMSFERRTRVFNMCYYGEAKPVAGGWTPWSQCDCDGTDQKTRSCTNPTRDTDGAECPDDGLGTSTDCASECSMDEPETLPVGEGEGEGEGCGCGSAIKGYFWNFEPCAGYSFPLETLEECKAAWDNGISDTYKLSV